MDLKITLKPELQHIINVLNNLVNSETHNDLQLKENNIAEQAITIEYLQSLIQKLDEENFDLANNLMQIYIQQIQNALNKGNSILENLSLSNPKMVAFYEKVVQSTPSLLNMFANEISANLEYNLNETIIPEVRLGVEVLPILKNYINAFNQITNENISPKQLLEIVNELFLIKVNDRVSNILLKPYHDITDISREAFFDEEIIKNTRREIIQKGLNLSNSYLIMVDGSVVTSDAWSNDGSSSVARKKLGRIRVYTDENTILDETKPYTIDEINRLIASRSLYIDLYASGLKNLNTPFRKRIGIDCADDKHYIIAKLLSEEIDVESIFRIKYELELLYQNSLNVCADILDKNIKQVESKTNQEQSVFGE